MSTVTTHVLDTSLGQPAAGMDVRLERLDAAGGTGTGGTGTGGTGTEPSPVAQGRTDEDGRVRDFGPDGLPPGTYRVVFDTGAYFARTGRRGFYPEVAISFSIDAADGHYHVPLVLSPFAYSTYRGS